MDLGDENTFLQKNRGAGAADVSKDVLADLDRRLHMLERRLEFALAPLQDQEAVANRLRQIELALGLKQDSSDA